MFCERPAAETAGRCPKLRVLAFMHHETKTRDHATEESKMHFLSFNIAGQSKGDARWFPRRRVSESMVQRADAPSLFSKRSIYETGPIHCLP